MSKAARYERGQVLVLVVFGIVALVGITALVIDGGNAFLDRRKAQNAADSAALASALARVRGGNFVQRAYEVAALNGYNNDGSRSNVQVYSPPIDGEHVGDIEYIEIIITSRVDTFFGGIIGRDFIINRVISITRTKTPELAELIYGYAVVSLAPDSDCDNKKSFWLHEEATLDITGGGVFVNSDNPDCALIQQANGSIRIRDGYPISIVGGARIQKPQLLTPYPPSTGRTPIPYPPPYMPPKVGCSKEAEISETGFSMSAGSWDEDFPPPDVRDLGKGVYCVNNFIVDGRHLSGSNVTFVVSGELYWGGTATLELSSPKKGDLAGLLVYMPIDNHNKVVLNASGSSSIKGTILAPGATIHINGNDSKSGFHSQIIGYRVDVKGNSNVVIKYNDEQNYDAITMPEVELTE
ncbi:MAG: pilus assembly protein TadG-related protein [Anaerolineales bacterium]|jgi:hypothetical protein